MKQPRILFWDIESTGLVANFGRMLCFGYKYLGDPKTHVISVTDFKKPFLHKHHNDYHVVEAAKRVLEQAGAWCTWYGSRFDVPFVQTRLLKHGLTPLPSPFPHIDGWRIARDKLKLSSNRLASVSDFLGLEDKTPLNGEIWNNASAGDPKAIKYVVEHCRQDVVVLEQAYLKLRPLITSHPVLRKLDTDSQNPCAVCGEENTKIKRGKRVAVNKVYQQYQCRGCGHWSSTRLLAA